MKKDLYAASDSITKQVMFISWISYFSEILKFRLTISHNKSFVNHMSATLLQKNVLQ